MTSTIDVFISYSRPDRETARHLAELLETRGLRVWWDWNLIGGQDYRAAIAEALETAQKVVVLWSEHSITSGFVLDEANHARERGKLVPLVIDHVSPPFGFGNLHTLTSHDLDRDIDILTAAISNVAAPAPRRLESRRLFSSPDRRALLTGGAAAGVSALLGAGSWWALNTPSGHGSDASGLNRIALVLGIDRYRHLPDLENAGNDASMIARALRQRGFKVMEVHNAGEHEVQEAIQTFKTLLGLGGVGLFYFAGQAAHIDGKDYILAADAPAVADEAALIAAAIEIGDVTGPIEDFLAGTPGDQREAGLCTTSQPGCGTTQGQVLSDAQPSGSAPRTINDNGVFLIYAAAEGELAMDGIGEAATHSPFAEALIAEIGADEGELTSLARRIRTRVKEVTDGIQNPVLEDQADAPFFFNRPESDPDDGVLRIVMLDSCRDNPFELVHLR